MTQPKKHKWLRRILWFLAIMFGALLCLYVLVTSSLFLTGIALPWIGKTAGIELAASSIDLSLLKMQVECRDVRVGPAAAPVAKVGRLFLKASLPNLKFPVIRECTVEGLDVGLHQNAKGQWNLPLLNSTVSAPPSPKAASKAAKPFKAPATLPLGIAKLNISGPGISFSSELPGHQCRVAVWDLRIALNNLLPEQPTQLTADAQLAIQTGALELRQGRLELVVNSRLKGVIPNQADLKLTVDQLQGTLNKIPLTSSRLLVSGDVTGEGVRFKVNRLSAEQFNGEVVTAAAEITAEGSIEPPSIKFSVTAAPVPPLLLAMAEPYLNGFTLGRLDIRSEGAVSLKDSQLNTVSDITITHSPDPAKKQQLPSLTIRLQHDLTVETERHLVSARKFHFQLIDQKRPVITIKLNEPFQYNWAETATATETLPSLQLDIDRFDLGQLQTFLPDHRDSLPAGIFSGTTTTGFDRDEKAMLTRGKFSIRDLGFKLPGFTTSGLTADITFQARGKQFREFFLPEFKLDLTRNARIVASLNGAAGYNLTERTGTFKLKLDRIGADTITLLHDAGVPLGPTPQLSQKLSPYALSLALTGGLNLRGGSIGLKHFLLELNRGDNGKLTIVPDAPPEFSWKSKDFFVHPIRAKINATGLDLLFLNVLLPHDQQIKSGKLNAALLTTYRPGDHQIQTSGDLLLSKMDIIAAGKRYADFTYQQQLDLTFKGKSLVVKQSHAVLSTSEGTAADLKVVADFDFAGGGFKIRSEIINVNQLAVKLATEKPSPADFFLHGNLEIARKGNATAPSVKGELFAEKVKTPQLSRPLNSHFNIDILPAKDKLQIRKLHTIITDGTEDTANFSLNGIVALPLNKGRTELTLKSTRLELKTLETLFKQPKTSSTQPGSSQPDDQSEPKVTLPEQPEPEPVQMGADAILHIDLDGISYGPNLQMTCRNSQITVKQSKITAEPINLNINQTPIPMTGEIDLGQAGGYPYKWKCQFKDLNAAPIINARANKDDRSIKATIKEFDADITGKGFRQSNLDRYLDGRIRITAADMSIPNSLRDTGYFKIILIPVEILAKMVTYVPQLNTTDDLAKAFSSAQSIYQNTDNLKLYTGKVDLDIEKGYLLIQEFDFTGDFIQKLTFRGRLPLSPDNAMQLNSQTTVSYLTIPVDIGGTLNNPKPNIPRMVAALLQSNFTKLLKGKQVKSIIGEADSLLKRTGEIITEGINGPQSKTPDSTNQKKETLPQLLDSIFK